MLNHPTLLRLVRSCAKWRGGMLLVATLSLVVAGGGRAFAGLASAPGNEAWVPNALNLPAAIPAQVTTLKIVAATDTSLVLQWTEVTTNGAGTAKYVVRYGSAPLVWTSRPDVTTGGCAAPVYGSTGAGGRLRSCVLGGLKAATFYAVQIVAYTGNLNTTAAFGPLSNIVEAATAERIGTLVVSRPRMWIDTVGPVRSVEVGHVGNWRWPVNVGFFSGSYPVVLRDSLDSLKGYGYLLIVKP